jgi:hypothetical protein
MFGKEDMLVPNPEACDGGVAALLSSLPTSYKTPYSRKLKEKFCDQFGRDMAERSEEAKSGAIDSYNAQLWLESLPVFISTARSEEILGVLLQMQTELLSRERASKSSSD